MASPRQLLNLFLAEVYRYRLALADQTFRLSEAVDLLKLKPDTDRAGREADPNTGEKWRALTEAQFFLGAVRGICYMADAMETTGETHQFIELASRVKEARAEFNARAPNALDARDFLTHLDEYMAGAGARRLPDPTMRVWLATPGDDLGICIGGVVISIAKTNEAANRLADQLIGALREVESNERTSR